MIILIKLFLNSKLDLIRTVKFVKQLFRIQIQKGGKVLIWNQVKSRMEACYSELVLIKKICQPATPAKTLAFSYHTLQFHELFFSALFLNFKVIRVYRFRITFTSYI